MIRTRPSPGSISIQPSTGPCGPGTRHMTRHGGDSSMRRCRLTGTAGPCVWGPLPGQASAPARQRRSSLRRRRGQSGSAHPGLLVPRCLPVARPSPSLRLRRAATRTGSRVPHRGSRWGGPRRTPAERAGWVGTHLTPLKDFQFPLLPRSPPASCGAVPAHSLGFRPRVAGPGGRQRTWPATVWGALD